MGDVRILVLVVILGGCGASGLTIANGTALGVSSASLLCDWAQTRRASDAGWTMQHEQNPIMGRDPSSRTVDAYFLGAAALNVLAWRLMPRRWRVVIPSIVFVVQADSIRSNIAESRPGWTDMGVCGVR